MVSMDIDMHSPSFRTARTSKRSRSPPSPSPFDRPSKRVSLGIHNPIPVARPLPSYAAPSPVQTRQLSEDWVVQTRGLRIDRDGCSPQLEHGSMLANIILEESDSERSIKVHDHNMTMDHDEPMHSLSVPPQVPCPPNSPAHMARSASNHPHHHPSPQEPFESSPSTHIPAFTPRRPRFQQICEPFSHPGTPQPQLSAEDYAMQSSLSSPPTPQPHQGPSPGASASARRPQVKLTMGPRADCEKCRLGVKGHWMHFE
ncbi:unnamed protein product [Somion occarium]|uniref:Uncharacterized protein n=1 Tax=Somion occarium TaxID=3059160 RepID=A0ABP1D9A1_9APHY